jgi:predicted amidohydrolase YtcJ
MKKTLLILCSLLIAQCSKLLAQKICFYNGKIYTVDARSSVAEAVVVENGRILFVGSTPEARAAWSDSRTKMINLEGKLMLPGFIDNHTHFADGGMYLSGIDLRGAKSTTEFKNILKKYVDTHKGEWVKSGNWDHESCEGITDQRND